MACLLYDRWHGLWPQFLCRFLNRPCVYIWLQQTDSTHNFTYHYHKLISSKRCEGLSSGLVFAHIPCLLSHILLSRHSCTLLLYIGLHYLCPIETHQTFSNHWELAQILLNSILIQTQSHKQTILLNVNPRKAQLVCSAIACWLGLKHVYAFPLLWVSADPSQLDHLPTLFLLPRFTLMFTRVHVLWGKVSAKEMSIKKPDISWSVVKDCGGGRWSAAAFFSHFCTLGTMSQVPKHRTASLTAGMNSLQRYL